MQKSVKVRGLALLATVALLGGTAWIATATTGAYFSDTQSGSIGGTIGSIKVTTSGGTGADHANLAFSNLQPGVAQTVKVNYQNTGANAEDVYISFNNATALSALNDLGSYGEVHIVANNTAVFDSANLDDHTNCGTFTPGLCWPLQSQYKVASNVAPGATGWVTFKFNYSGALTNASMSTNFNPYPNSTQTHNPGTPTASGLPYQIVATQVGIQP